MQNYNNTLQKHNRNYRNTTDHNENNNKNGLNHVGHVVMTCTVNPKVGSFQSDGLLVFVDGL